MKHNTKNNRNSNEKNSLFAIRIENRLTISTPAIENLTSKFAMEEDVSSNTHIQNIYFDTSEQAMPLGNVVRSRRYLPKRTDIEIDDNTYYIDRGKGSFQTKTKERMVGTIKETTKELDDEYSLRLDNFRPYVATSYYRRIFRGEGVRVTVDSALEGFYVDEKAATRKLILPPDLSQVEIKSMENNPLSFQINDLLHKNGAVPSISKHYMLYNSIYMEKRNELHDICRSEIPDKEYEVKFDADNETPFTKLTIAALKKEVRGFSFWDFAGLHSFESINHYRKVPDTEEKARVMYWGSDKPYIIAKNLGVFTENGILLRTEKKNKLTNEQIDGMMNEPLAGASRRIKKFLFMENESTGRIYCITVDLNQDTRGREMYQLEVEYWKSKMDRISPSSNPDREIIDDIDSLGKEISRITGLTKRSTLRKEDWLS